MKKKNKTNWNPQIPLIVDPEFRIEINRLGFIIGELPESQDFSDVYGAYKKIMRSAVKKAIEYHKLKEKLFPD